MIQTSIHLLSTDPPVYQVLAEERGNRISVWCFGDMDLARECAQVAHVELEQALARLRVVAGVPELAPDEGD